MSQNYERRLRPEMWFDGEIETLDAEFLQTDILVKGVPVHLQNYKIISFAGLPF